MEASRCLQKKLIRDLAGNFKREGWTFTTAGVFFIHYPITWLQKFEFVLFISISTL